MDSRNAHKLVFRVNLSVGDSFIAFLADRKGKDLFSVTPVWVKNADHDEQEPMSEGVFKIFEATLTPTDKKSKVLMRVACFPDREIELALKKQKDGEPEGRVVGSVKHEKDGEMYVLERVEAEVQKVPPDLTSMTGFGSRGKGSKKTEVEETIEITAGMKAQFDVSNFL